MPFESCFSKKTSERVLEREMVWERSSFKGFVKTSVGTGGIFAKETFDRFCLCRAFDDHQMFAHNQRRASSKNQPLSNTECRSPTVSALWSERNSLSTQENFLFFHKIHLLFPQTVLRKCSCFFGLCKPNSRS